MSKKKLKVKFVDPMRDYANKEWNFIDFLDPITKEEKKAYKKRLQQDAEELFEYYLCIGEANVENKEKYIKEYKKRLEECRAINIANNPDEYLHAWQDDYDEELDNMKINPDDLVGVYDENENKIVWIPYKDSMKMDK